MNGEPVYAALQAATHGGRVFPCDAKTRMPLIEDFATAATRDPKVIVQMWATNPTAIPGVIPVARKRIEATPYVWRDPSQIPRRKWLYGRHLIRKYASATIALPGVGKSSLVLTEAIALATGRDLLGIKPAKRCRVWYWNGEDPHEETERRVAAICIEYKITPEELEGWFFTDSGRDTEIVLARMTRDGATIAEPVANELTDTIAANEIDVITLDPFVSSHRVTENDNNAIDLVTKRWAKIANDTDCAVELVHHSRKLGNGSTEAKVQDGRGAGALIAAVRSARVLNGMTKQEAEAIGEQNHRLFFREENGKGNLAPPPEKANWYRLKSVPLGNGDSELYDNGDQVGVVTPWQWPDLTAGLTGNDFDKVARVARDKRWRADSQAAEWIGYAVAKALDLDAFTKPGKAKINATLKMLRAAGTVQDYEASDDKGNKRMFSKISDAVDDD